ncbi:radical SAM protein [Jeongeupia chitinilytica]|uniref:Radical SAM core domain-containing protein n=1 Tax=Jeongeupia chitinilytica TaxID=1041641 RepID=A0ABQ3H2Q1_9NEIS|nr:radical SAM protein [Jeongeupia chitinilytica]GHD64301.1 hypothetical protein GCM10007350_23190 [Jeongeupia chitinilytica]
MPSRSDLFCSKPFQFLDLQRSKAGVCCWVRLPTWRGHSSDLSIEAVWNSENAQKVRASIHDGSFRYCSNDCPFLHGAAKPAALSEASAHEMHGFLETISNPVTRKSDVTDPQLRTIIDEQSVILDTPPAHLECGFDNSCNLSCPTCRTEKLVETEFKDEIQRIQRTVEEVFLPHLQTLYITGSGDPFGSPYFNRWLRQMDASKLGADTRIHLHSNAQLWTPEMWAKIPEAVRTRIKSCEISIDAASEATYAINRRGGDFARLLKNLDFIATLRRSQALRYFKIHMVVQANNFREMPDFVALGARVGADEVYFSHLSDWGTFSEVELAKRQVHIATHPLHEQLQEILSSRLLHHPSVNLGNLNDLQAPRSAPRSIIKLHELSPT